MTGELPIGGVIHTYQKYDAMKLPGPRRPPPDLVSPAFEHMLMYGRMRRLTEEELARAVRLDASQIQGLGPSIDALVAMLLERKRKILEKYESQSVEKQVRDAYVDAGRRITPPKKLRQRFDQAFREEQIHELERVWYAAGDDTSKFARQIVQLVERLGEKYAIDELAANYAFTGRTPMTVPLALAVKEELDKIEELLKQLAEARDNAQIAIIDMETLSEFAEPGAMESLREMEQMVNNYLRELAERQGLERDDGGFFRLTPEAHRIFQGKLLERLFSGLAASRTGRHSGPTIGEGAVEMQTTKPYEFGDSLANMDVPQSFVNAMIRTSRGAAGLPSSGLRGTAGLPSSGESAANRPKFQLLPEDIEIHRTRNSPKCATVVIMDMSGSMRYDLQYVNVKRMALALAGLIRRKYPGDFLQFIEMATFARCVPASQVVELLCKVPTIHDPVVRLKADMSDERISEAHLPPHFTNIQHALQLARKFLALQDTPNRQVVLITDGLPTAHFEGSELFMLYPPDPRTEQATMREGALCKREGITINMFLVPSWSQSEEDIRFAYRLAEQTTGRVFFTAGRDLDRFVVWDYVQRKREILS
ncbi:MAG: VWA domain-containing protein [Planctomycetales bacterium]|nr:VWA domain-containing protein [Planctomycetales bacterium]